jgi:hypothetical protein
LPFLHLKVYEVRFSGEVENKGGEKEVLMSYWLTKSDENCGFLAII